MVVSPWWKVGGLALAWGLSACSSGSRRHDGGSDLDANLTPSIDADLASEAASDAPSAEPDGGSGDGAARGGSDANGNPAGEASLADAARASDAGPASCDREPDVQNLALEPVAGAGTLTKLVFAAQPPGSSDWYLVLQTGTIRVLTGGALRDGSFLDVSSQIVLVDDGDERGLLGLAFAPDYPTSGKFYVMMTATEGADANRDFVIEYQRSADPYAADPASAKQLLALPASAPNHNGGTVTFGPDGMLYVGTGDGGGGCNDVEYEAPQQTSSPFGKILRLDPEAPAPYAASGNPFANSGGDARVLHYGLRNPFRFAFDRLTGDLFIGDVGQDSYEELDFAASGAQGLDFGWAAFEGTHADTCPNHMLAAGAAHTPPIDEIDRRKGQLGPFADWVSIMGGVTYRGQALPQLAGVHLYGDYTGARMRALRKCGDLMSPIATIDKDCDPNAPDEACFRHANVPSFRELTAMVEDGAGELYFVANRSLLLKVVARP